MDISRRQALWGTLLGASGIAGCATEMNRQSTTPLPYRASIAFAHGVASGDPALDSVVIWTRVTTQDPVIPVEAEISQTKDFSSIVKIFRTETSQNQDYTVKIIADGLEPGQTYFYRFRVGNDVSPIGRTKTLPERTDEARFAVVSCSNFPFGYFNAYDHIARRDDVDAVLHLGDYIYEYGVESYGGKKGASLGRNHFPTHEILTLKDYRQRHAQYKADPSSQAMHGAHPLIAIWDDHETANDSWKGGAQNHQSDTEGSWEDRRKAALQAYYEWMPVRDPEPGRPREALYKAWTWGGLLTLTALETRLMARTKQIEYTEIVPTLKGPDDIARFERDILQDPGRYLLGETQLAFVEKTIKGSVARQEPWRLIANQAMMAKVVAPNLKPYASEEMIADLEKEWDQARAFVEFSVLGLPLNLDAWDGYPAARELLYKRLKGQGATDLVVLTGDSHEFWANNLNDAQGNRMGVELGTSGVTSPGPSLYLKDKAFDYSLLLRRENEAVRYHNPLHNGYIHIVLKEDKGIADYISVDIAQSTQYQTASVARFTLAKKNGTVEFTQPRGLGIKERVLF